MNVCTLESSASDLRGKALTYANVRARVVRAGRFSYFEAPRTHRAIVAYGPLFHDPRLAVTRDGFPWYRVVAR
jgi:hypothetical protein